jgi:hypothetical protein
MEIKPNARLCDFIRNDDMLFRRKDLKFNLASLVSYLGEYSLDLQNANDQECIIAYFSAFPNKTGMIDHPHYAFQFVYRNPGFAAALKKAVYRVTTQPSIEVNSNQFWYTVAHIMKAFMQSMVELSTLYEDQHRSSDIRQFLSSAYSEITRLMFGIYVRYTGDIYVRIDNYIAINQKLIEFGETQKLLKEVAAISTGNVQPERADLMLRFNCKTHPYLMGSKIRR